MADTLTRPSLLRLDVRNFKSLKRVQVPLGPLNVLVGPNGAGKSNFLQAIQFLGDAVRNGLKPTVENWGGYDRLFFHGDTTGRIELKVSALVTRHSSPKAPDEYRLAFGLRQGPRRVLTRSEEFTFKRTQGQGRRIRVTGSKAEIIDEGKATRELGLHSESLGLATFPSLADKEGGGVAMESLRDLFATFRVFDPDVRSATLPALLSSATTLRENASNLAANLFWLSQQDEERFTALVQDARHLVPGLLDLTLEPVGGVGSAMAVHLHERGLHVSTPLADASYGTVRALALLALLYDPSPPPLTCIEEIDHGLHPYALDLLVERVREASKRSQFLLATHSPALVNRLRSDELIIVDREADGSTRMPAADADEIRRMEDVADDLHLGELWFAGALGGVPD